MAINLPSGLNITVKQPVDTRLVLTKAEILAMRPTKVPDNYFCLCSDDNKIYIYNAANTTDPVTGLYRPIDDYLTFSSPEAKAQIEAAVENSVKLATIENNVAAIETIIGDNSRGLIKDLKDTNDKIVSLNTKMDEVVTPHVEEAEKRLDDIEDTLYYLTLDDLSGVVDGGVILEDDEIVDDEITEEPSEEPGEEVEGA